MYGSLKASLLAISLLPAAAAAQGIELDRAGRAGFALEALHPTLAEDGTSLASGAFFLSAHRQIGATKRVVIEIPTAYASFDDDVHESGGSIGNPYLGIQLGQGNTVFDVGVRLPFSEAANEAGFIGFIADAMRMEAFVPKLASLRVSVRREAPLSERTYFEFQVAPSLWVPTGESSSEKEVILGYGGGFGYRTPAFRLQGRVGGRAILSESDVDISERTFHQAALSADFGSGRVRPGLYAAAPLDDDMGEMVDAIFGLTLQIGIGR